MRDADQPRDLRDWLILKDRALAVAAEGITIADARGVDRPLIYVNEGFERLTGYSADEALGRNCKFLQGPDTDSATVDTIRAALQSGNPCTVEIRNRRKDGTPFWNRLSITPVRDESGEVTHFIGVQSDVTDRRRAEDDLRQAYGQMRRNLENAADVQQAWLPHTLPEIPGYDLTWQFRPCDELGGDGLNVLRLDEHHLALYVLDVSGHGVPAALLSMTLNHSLVPLPEQSLLYREDPGSPSGKVPQSPSAVVTALDRQFDAGPKTGKFFTIVYGVLDLRSGRFRYATAGHPAPVQVNAAGARHCDLATGVPVGYVPGFRYSESVVDLAPGDRLYLYSDGAVDVDVDEGSAAGEQRLLELLADVRSRPLDAGLGEVVSRILGAGPRDELPDDITILGLERRAGGTGGKDQP